MTSMLIALLVISQNATEATNATDATNASAPAASASAPDASASAPAASDASASAPDADVASAPPSTLNTPDASAPDAPARAAGTSGDVEQRYQRTRTVLTAFADEARGRRIATAVTSGIVGAGLIGAGITYVAVGHLDHQLSEKDHDDTELAGFVIGGTAVIPAAIMVAQLLSTTPDEARLAEFDAPAASDVEKAERVDVAVRSLELAKSEGSIAPIVGGAGFIAGGLVSAAAGGVFLALPHIPDILRGPMAHATGAELIGAGVSSVGIGTALIIGADSSASADLQLALLDAGGTSTSAAAE